MKRIESRRQLRLPRRHVDGPDQRTAPDADPVESAFARAIQHHRAGRLHEAEALYRSILDAQPSHHDALHCLGIVLHQLGDDESAVDLIGKAVAVKPDGAEAHSNLGNALRELGRLDEAVAAHRQAIAVKPKYAMAHFNLGNALMQQDKLNEAVACYRTAISLDPACAARHYQRALDHTFVAGDPEIDALRSLLEMEGVSEADKNPILFALGKAHDDIGDYHEAFSYFSAANREVAKRGKYDPSRHRRKVTEIKKAFREPRRLASDELASADHVPVFVVGMSRSGKTLVESLLTEHEDVYGAGETMNWPRAIKAVLDKYAISASFPECMKYLSDDQIEEIGRVYTDNTVKNSPNSRLFINTLSGNSRSIGLIVRALPMARIIFCHRDPMDHCMLIYFHPYAHRNDYSYDLGNIASFYINYHDMMTHWRRLYGDRILGVRYEDLVRDPEGTCARLYRYCGLDHDPAAVRHAFTTDEIGHWKHYERELAALRKALDGPIRQSDDHRDP